MSKRNITSVLLDKDIVAKLKSKKGIAQSIIQTAIKRFFRGDFIIQNDDIIENNQNVLIYPIENKPENLTGVQINSIIKAHFANPDKRILEQIAALDDQINGMFASYQGLPYIITESDK